MRLMKITYIFLQVNDYVILVALQFILSLKGSDGARILAVFPIHSKSHFNVDSAVVKELANRGHEVTVVSPFPEENPLPNYKDIVLKGVSFEELFGSHEGKLLMITPRHDNYLINHLQYDILSFLRTLR